MYGAQDILVAEVQLQRAYPGGPARARFIARHGPDNEVTRQLHSHCAEQRSHPGDDGAGRAADRRDLRSGARRRAPVSRPVAQSAAAAGAGGAGAAPPKPVNVVNDYQVQVIGKDVTIYNFAMAHLRTLAGRQSATPQQINPGGTSYILVAYHGTIAQLAAALTARGWVVDYSGTVVRIHPAGDKPPALPPPPSAGTPAPAGFTPPAPRKIRALPNEAGAGPDRASARLAPKRRRCPLHRLGRESRGVRSFPQVEHLAGQGDDPDRPAALRPNPARAQLRRAGRRADCSTMPSSATRRSCSTPGTRRRIPDGRWSWSPTQVPPAWSPVASRSQDPACESRRSRASATRTMPCSPR